VDKAIQLEALKQKAISNKTLPLKSGATNLVFGVGNPEAEILLCGEGPGYWEDIKAEPFVGNAGLLLNKLLLSIGIKREDVYITNVVMYRPPDNRDPEQSEIDAFAPYLDEIIDIVSPKIIVTLGRFSMAKFIPGAYISSIHGKPMEIGWKGKLFTIVPMYHPAAALRNGDIMFKIKKDFSDLPRILEETKKVKTDTINVEEKKEETKQESLF